MTVKERSLKQKTVTLPDEIEKLYHKLVDQVVNCFPLNVAGRFLFYDADQNAFILAMHSVSPEKTQEATMKVWDSLPESLKEELQKLNIGFAGKQI